MNIIIYIFVEVNQILHICSKIMYERNTMKNYGEGLKEQRLERGLTLSQLEKFTGISNVNLGRWERGEVLPSIEFCVQLADFYGITVDELIGREQR